MSQKVKIELNHEGVRQLLKSQEMASYLEEIATAKAKALGKGYGTDVYYGRNRVNVSVCTTNEKAYQDNLENNTLLKGIGA